MFDWNVAAVIAKALMYGASLVAGGGALFLALFTAQLVDSERSVIARFIGAVAVAALYVTIARIMVLSALLGDEFAGLWDWSLIQIVLDGSEGLAAAIRAGGLIAIVLASLGARNLDSLAALGALAVASSFALTGHAGDVEPNALARVLIATHVLAVSYWIGALFPLFAIIASADQARAGAILRRFGDIAAIVISALIVAGLIVLWLLLGTVEAILTTTYGRLVLLKLAFVAGLLTLAALNKWRLTPAIAAGDKTAATRLRWSIAAEMALAAAILVVTATFTTVVGPPEAH